MMKNLFTLVALLGFTQLFGQATFNIAPLNPSEVYGPDSDDLKAENHITNLTDQVKNHPLGTYGNQPDAGLPHAGVRPDLLLLAFCIYQNI